MAQSRRSLLYAVGADPLLVSAVAADLPEASVRRFRSFTTALPASTADEPAVVLIGPDVSQADAERAAARRWWGARPVVVEVIAGRPLALLWLGIDTVRVVEMEPGFLAPYLVADLEGPGSVLRWQPVRARDRIAHAAAALLIMGLLSSAVVEGWIRSDRPAQSEPGAVTVVAAADLSPEPSIAEPACFDDDPC